jgi:hypothetical protein
MSCSTVRGAQMPLGSMGRQIRGRLAAPDRTQRDSAAGSRSHPFRLRDKNLATPIVSFRLGVASIPGFDLALPELYINTAIPEVPMFIEPRQLIADTIDQLETISAYFADEVDERIHAPDKLPVEALAAKEALQTIKILIPRLRTAQGNLSASSAQLQFRECLNCD